MAAIEDRAYSAACGQLATVLSISIAAARRRVEMVAAQRGLRGDAGAKTALAHELLAQAQAQSEPHGQLLDSLLEGVPSEMNFMDED